VTPYTRDVTRWRFVIAVVVALAFCSSATTVTWSHANSVAPAQQLFDTTLELLRTNYHGYAPFDPEALRTSFQPRLLEVCRGKESCDFDTGGDVVTQMVQSLNDPHTYRLTPLETKRRELEFSGSAALGTGLKLAIVPDAPALVVTRVQQGGAAHGVDLRRGDLIWALNRQSLSDFGSAQAALNAWQQLESSDEPIQLTVARGRSRLEVVLKPQPLSPWLPQLDVQDGVGIITFFQFKTSGAVARRTHQLVLEAQRSGLKGLVLDVRDSQGGLITEMLASVGAFLSDPVLLDDFKTGQVKFEFEKGKFIQTEANQQRFETPMIATPALWTSKLSVLTNRNAKSAPEYLAFMLQQNGVTVLGEETLGALNTSNSFFPLPDDSSLAITLGRSLKPDGTPYPERVTPNIHVPDDLVQLATGRDAPLELALRDASSAGSVR
jgi:carboxyl-terminal processing protease